MGETLQTRVLAYIRRHELMRPGDRVGVAVSGGADSVALLRLLLELRTELGVVLSVVHFNHQIRGADADADEQFVRALAGQYGLEFHGSSGNAPQFSRQQRLSLETAARELRYQFFRLLLRQHVVDRVATAHTLDDQAETVLLRLVRGAWTKGLAGIHPKLPVASCELRPRENARSLDFARQNQSRSARDDTSVGTSIVRPLLEVRRPQLVQYLSAVGQEWREDASNRDLQHLRNRVRHVLLPLLEREFNPAIRDRLAEMAEIARGEEHYWERVLRSLTTEDTGDTEEIRLPVHALRSQPVAVQRRMVRALAARCGLELDFRQVEEVLALRHAASGARCELQQGWSARRGRDHIVFHAPAQFELRDYEYPLGVPGVVHIHQLGLAIRATLTSPSEIDKNRYNAGELLDVQLLGAELRVRNWRPGDRFWPAHSKSAKKVKELLQERHASGAERALWPVIVRGNELAWMWGFGVAERFAARPDAEKAVAVQVTKA